MSAPPPDLNRAVEEQAFALDRKWFKRRPVPGEIDAFPTPPGVVPLLLVKQVIPGFHCRLCDRDRCLGTLWECLTPGESQSFAIETAAVLLARSDAAECAAEAAS